MDRSSPKRYGVYEVIGLGMHYGYRHPVEQPQSHEALLLIPEAVILECEGWTIEHLGCIDEVDAVVLEVLQPLRLIPFEPHLRSVYTPIAERNAHVLPPDNAANQRRADARNPEHIYGWRALAAFAC